MTAIATEPSALERYRQLKADLARVTGALEYGEDLDEAWRDMERSPPESNVRAKRILTQDRIKLLTALRNVLVERLSEGQAKIYTKRTIDTPSPATAEMEEKWIALLEEYRTVSDELHSLAPQLAVEAYTQSLSIRPAGN